MNHANNPITTQLNEPVPMWFLTKLIIVRSRNILSTSIRSVKQVAMFPKHPRSSGASIYVNSSFFFILLFPNLRAYAFQCVLNIIYAFPVHLLRIQRGRHPEEGDSLPVIRYRNLSFLYKVKNVLY